MFAFSILTSILTSILLACILILIRFYYAGYILVLSRFIPIGTQGTLTTQAEAGYRISPSRGAYLPISQSYIS